METQRIDVRNVPGEHPYAVVETEIGEIHVFQDGTVVLFQDPAVQGRYLLHPRDAAQMRPAVMPTSW